MGGPEWYQQWKSIKPKGTPLLSLVRKSSALYIILYTQRQQPMLLLPLLYPSPRGKFAYLWWIAQRSRRFRMHAKWPRNLSVGAMLTNWVTDWKVVVTFKRVSHPPPARQYQWCFPNIFTANNSERKESPIFKKYICKILSLFINIQFYPKAILISLPSPTE